VSQVRSKQNNFDRRDFYRVKKTMNKISAIVEETRGSTSQSKLTWKVEVGYGRKFDVKNTILHNSRKTYGNSFSGHTFAKLN
jgi:hypothetical protein